MLRFGASGAYVYAEANEVLAATEALVLDEGECSVSYQQFSQVVRTFATKNLTISADARRLSIGRFMMPVTAYSPKPVALSERIVLPCGPVNRVTEPAYPAAIEWSWFTDQLLESLFTVYGRTSEREWAARMWQRLALAELTTCSNSCEYNAVLVRLAVLAMFYRAWVWHARYGSGGDPYDRYTMWFGELPFAQAALEEPEEVTYPGDLLAEWIERERDKVFTAVAAGYDPGTLEVEFALDLRHAAGIGDDFGEHVVLDGATADQQQFFEECGLSFREFDALGLIAERFK